MGGPGWRSMLVMDQMAQHADHSPAAVGRRHAQAPASPAHSSHPFTPARIHLSSIAAILAGYWAVVPGVFSPGRQSACEDRGHAPGPPTLSRLGSSALAAPRPSSTSQSTLRPPILIRTEPMCPFEDLHGPIGTIRAVRIDSVAVTTGLVRDEMNQHTAKPLVR